MDGLVSHKSIQEPSYSCCLKILRKLALFPSYSYSLKTFLSPKVWRWCRAMKYNSVVWSPEFTLDTSLDHKNIALSLYSRARSLYSEYQKWSHACVVDVDILCRRPSILIVGSFIFSFVRIDFIYRAHFQKAYFWNYCRRSYWVSKKINPT